MKNSIYDNDILIVDDNFELRAMLRTFLSKEGYRNIRLAADVRSALSEIAEKCPDFIILDVNLPDGDGFSLMKSLKQKPEYQTVPVLFLSARDKDADRLLGLGLGADDYMVKPFLPKELILRMGAILKRSYVYAEELLAAMPETEGEAGLQMAGQKFAGGAAGEQAVRTEVSGKDGAHAVSGMTRAQGSVFPESSVWNRTGMEYGYFNEEMPLPQKLCLGTHIVDFEAGTVQKGGTEEKLTVKELKILETLAKSRGKIVTFDNLCKAVWNAQYYTYENTVMVHIRRLREKIEDDPSHPKWLTTARGIGYKLNELREETLSNKTGV